MGNSKIDNLFGAIGFGFPENKEELKSFDEAFEDYPFQANIQKINPKKILADIKKSKTEITKVDYHKRTVLAAQIVYKLQGEYTLGHLKLQKLMYLCQHTTSMSLHTNFLKQAMGPYDPNLMRSIDKQFKVNQWFEYSPKDYPKYKSLARVGGHKDWYERYFEKQLFDIDFLLEKFRTYKTDQVEIIATVFGCWKEALEYNELINNELIIKKFYMWHKDKAKYDKERINSAIEWMKTEGICPL
ncbi:type I restriction enzyme S subunit [Arenibacter algicola]|uniref:Type I restriction enzyme S subunit n=1 Tax=Arenibacter algicola TaxID=616991 RepID=A0ABY3A6Y7_9FLAO